MLIKCATEYCISASDGRQGDTTERHFTPTIHIGIYIVVHSKELTSQIQDWNICLLWQTGNYFGWTDNPVQNVSGIILVMGSANERRRYNVTSSLVGRAHNQNETCT